MTVTVGQVAHGRPDAAFSTLAASSLLLNTTVPVDGGEHLQLRAALDTIAVVVSRRLHTEAFEQG
ncbi:hypothetical protein ACWDRR_33075 [Kitasatospora sp. NPDC003701]